MLHVARSAFESMVAQAEAGYPNEVCGVLAGRDERTDSSDDRTDPSEDRHVTAVHAVPNVADHPRTEYRMAPEEQLAAIDAVEDAGRDLVGFYHSHPAGPAGPSPTDEARATWPGYVYAIVSLEGEDPELGAWEWTGEAFEELDVQVEG